jgi:branched-chain amino acid transport system substrate-binding protein
MRKSTHIATLAMSTLTALALIGCSSPTEGSAEGEGGAVHFGIVEPLTGAAAIYGQEAKRGADLAAKEINATDEKCFDGNPIELTYEDDKGTPEGGVTAVQKLMTREKVNAIGGGANSSVVLAEASITRDQIVQINAAAQADAITEDAGSMFFQINNTVTQNGKAFDTYITETLKPASMAYMGEDTAFNAGVLANLQGDMSAAGIEITDSAQYQSDTTDFTSILNKLKASGGEVLYIADAFPSRTATILQQASQVGGFSQILISPGVVSQDGVDTAGKYMEGVITGDIYVSTLDSPENEAFVAAIEDEYQTLPGKSELVNYESVYALCTAMQNAGTSTDQEKIAQALADLELPTPRGTLTFGEKGRAVAPSFFIQQVKSGKLEVIDEVPSQQ